MPKARKVEASEYDLPDGEYYPAELTSVDEQEIKFFRKDKQGNRTNEEATFLKWRWEFTITDGEYTGRRAWGDTPAEYNTREDNLVRLWGETLMGRELEIGEEFDTDKILGLPCMIAVRHDEPRPKKDGQMFYPCPVDEVLPRTGGFDANPPF